MTSYMNVNNIQLKFQLYWTIITLIMAQNPKEPKYYCFGYKSPKTPNWIPIEIVKKFIVFPDVLPIETVLRIWDCLFNEGSKILLRVAITLVIQNQSKLIQTNEFGQLVETFHKCTVDHNVVQCHQFLTVRFRFELNKSALRNWISNPNKIQKSHFQSILSLDLIY